MDLREAQELGRVPLTVDAIRERRAKQFEVFKQANQVLRAGYQTDFWRLIREEMKTRREALQKRICYEVFKTEDDLQILHLIQAEIRVYDVLLAQEETLPDTSKITLQP